ncbi:imm11 family protein [Kordia jejudonensis]|uniref:imm11 family protein n=1 Tax=Kordia jejudonensis TaxID=1348245 RepID=UPI0006296D80|nr:DUF1629 domain-containing protein [Kordia jejudonensis]
MNNYYILNFEISSNSYTAEEVTLSDMSVYDQYADGISLKEKDIKITYHKNRGEVQHFIDNLYSLPTLSEQVTEILLKHCKNEIELYPVHLEKKTNLNFFFVNLLHLVDVIDFEKSDCVLLTPDVKIIEEVEKLVLFEEKIQGLNIFRLKGLKLQIVVSEKLKNDLEQLNLSELEFIPIDEFTYDMNSFEW